MLIFVHPSIFKQPQEIRQKKFFAAKPMYVKSFLKKPSPNSKNTQEILTMTYPEKS